MALGQFVTGAYNGTFNSDDIGMTKEGYELEVNTYSEEIKLTDLYGDSLIDLVQRGADFKIQVTALEWNDATVGAFYPQADLGTLVTSAEPFGRLGSSMASVLTLTAVANTLAAASAPAMATITAPLSMLAPSSNLKLMFTSKLREIPLRLVLLPYNAGGGIIEVFSVSAVNWLAVGLLTMLTAFLA